MPVCEALGLRSWVRLDPSLSRPLRIAPLAARPRERERRVGRTVRKAAGTGLQVGTTRRRRCKGSCVRQWSRRRRKWEPAWAREGQSATQERGRRSAMSRGRRGIKRPHELVVVQCLG